MLAPALLATALGTFTERRCFDHASHIAGEGYAVQGNILAGRATIEAMARAYEAARDARKPLAERLLAALDAQRARDRRRRARAPAPAGEGEGAAAVGCLPAGEWRPADRGCC
ncbi:MAG TPA: DUF1028 domain-containing protein [Anaeromyxobacteraceae bacterium]